MTNKEKILNELGDNVERLARLLITCRDITESDGIPTYEYITSDGSTFDDNSFINAFEEAVKYEIEWLSKKI